MSATASVETSCRVFLSELPALSGSTVLAAVSGGADSVCLLHVLHRLQVEFGFLLRVLTVDHGIRESGASGGDAAFVSSFCASLLPPVPCKITVFAQGEIASLARQRGRGLEEAARFARYAALEAEAAERECRYIMLGHNLDDRCETVLMRLLQGGQSLAVLKPRRGKLARPLAELTRAEIIGYLTENVLSWREDATNNDERFLRNRIRSRLVPALQQNFPDYRTALSSVSENAALDEDCLREALSLRWSRPDQTEAVLRCPVSAFDALHPALRLRFLQQGCRLLGIKGRISRRQLLLMARSRSAYRASGLYLSRRAGILFFELDIVHKEKSGYLIYIDRPGRYRIPSAFLDFSGDGQTVLLEGRYGPFPLPLVLRSRESGDYLEKADGRSLSLKKLLAHWSVPPEDRDKIPVIECQGRVVAVYGAPFGFPVKIV